MASPLLSIAIPAYDRPNELLHALECFVRQIEGRYEAEIEICVSDDCSPDDSLQVARKYCDRHDFLSYRRYEANKGLERNLIDCAEECRGEYLWLFGDDDFLEAENALDRLIPLLRQGQYDVLVVNRSRRSFDLSKLLHENWMKLNPRSEREFTGLREFCLCHGFISIIGFISVNIFRREAYARADASNYLGTMYPQLGALLEAFHDKPTMLIGQPLVCHRTQTAEEKREALGRKISEADFMADIGRRDAMYFSHPYVAMLKRLIDLGAFSPDDIMQIPENTVIVGKLIDFLLKTVVSNHEMELEAEPSAWETTNAFFRALPLDADQRERIMPILELRQAYS